MRACPSCLSVYATDLEFCGLDGARLVETAADPLVGKIVGRYRLEEQVGAGASGLVYRATSLERGEDLAVKILFGEAACDRRTVQRFRREAETARKLRHPNIVKVVDFEIGASGLAFLAMELLTGMPLDVVVSTEAPLLPERAARIAQQIASGLAEAHRQGFVHRDLKPGNVVLVRQGVFEIVKILDFGIVGHMRSDRGESRLTKTGYVVGTPVYMAPEQIDESVDLGPSCDLYSLGVILYEMLTGRPPFSGTVEQILVKKLTREPEPLPEHGEIGRLTLQLLARDPKNRPPSALHVSAEIHRLSLLTEDAKTVLSRSPYANDVINAPTVPFVRLPSPARRGRPVGDGVVPGGEPDGPALISGNTDASEIRDHSETDPSLALGDGFAPLEAGSLGQEATELGDVEEITSLGEPGLGERAPRPGPRPRPGVERRPDSLDLAAGGAGDDGTWRPDALPGFWAAEVSSARPEREFLEDELPGSMLDAHLERSLGDDQLVVPVPSSQLPEGEYTEPSVAVAGDVFAVALGEALPADDTIDRTIRRAPSVTSLTSGAPPGTGAPGRGSPFRSANLDLTTFAPDDVPPAPLGPASESAKTMGDAKGIEAKGIAPADAIAGLGADDIFGRGVPAQWRAPEAAFSATAIANLRDAALEPAELANSEQTAAGPRAGSWTRHHLTYAAVGLVGFGIGLFAVLAVLASSTPHVLEVPAAPATSTTAHGRLATHTATTANR